MTAQKVVQHKHKQQKEQQNFMFYLKTVEDWVEFVKTNDKTDPNKLATLLQEKVYKNPNVHLNDTTRFCRLVPEIFDQPAELVLPLLQHDLGVDLRLTTAMEVDLNKSHLFDTLNLEDLLHLAPRILGAGMAALGKRIHEIETRDWQELIQRGDSYDNFLREPILNCWIEYNKTIDVESLFVLLNSDSWIYESSKFVSQIVDLVTRLDVEANSDEDLRLLAEDMVDLLCNKKLSQRNFKKIVNWLTAQNFKEFEEYVDAAQNGSDAFAQALIEHQWPLGDGAVLSQAVLRQDIASMTDSQLKYVASYFTRLKPQAATYFLDNANDKAWEYLATQSPSTTYHVRLANWFKKQANITPHQAAVLKHLRFPGDINVKWKLLPMSDIVSLSTHASPLSSTWKLRLELVKLMGKIHAELGEEAWQCANQILPHSNQPTHMLYDAVKIAIGKE